MKKVCCLLADWLRFLFESGHISRFRFDIGVTKDSPIDGPP